MPRGTIRARHYHTQRTCHVLNHDARTYVSHELIVGSPDRHGCRHSPSTEWRPRTRTPREQSPDVRPRERRRSVATKDAPGSALSTRHAIFAAVYISFLFVENKIPNKTLFFSAVSPRRLLQDRETMRGASARDESARGASLPANADARAVCVELAAFAPLNSAAG